MPIYTITFNGQEYPILQSLGFSAQYAFPFAEKICKGTGYDIGYGKEEWKLPGAIGVDPAVTPEFHATNLPPMSVDFIFSSHCLEHTPDWIEALDHWATRLKTGGVLFLYLPHYEQRYWRAWNQRQNTKINSKHIHNLTPEILKDYLSDRGWNKIFVTGYDLNHSFYVVAEKK